MNSCQRKIYNYPHQTWIFLLNSHKIQQKRAVIPTNCNLYAYAANNPVHYIDPDGNFYYTSNIQKSSSAHQTTRVYIFRLNNGLGNAFDSTRIVLKNGKCVFIDRIGANCTDYNYDGKKNFTKPDGVYYYSFDGLSPNGDGTYDSQSFHNTIKTKTDDPNIPADQRNAINNNPGDFYDHANQFKDSHKPYNSNANPGGAGCDISMNGQDHHDAYMKILLKGVDRPEEIRLKIISANNME